MTAEKFEGRKDKKTEEEVSVQPGEPEVAYPNLPQIGEGLERFGVSIFHVFSTSLAHIQPPIAIYVFKNYNL